MALPIPIIDDKKFEKLAEDARILIPRYARTWTDHNISDPGITFLELFTWLAEMQMYQMDQVTDEIRREFLKLVDIEPFYPKAARTSIHFDPIPENAPSLIEAGTPVVPVGKESIRFEVSEDFFLTRSKLAAVISQYESKTIDYSELNVRGNSYFLPFGPRMARNATLQLGFESWFQEKEIQIAFFLFETVDEVSTSELAEEIPDWTSVQLAWEYHSRDGWRELELIRDTTANLSRNGRIIFQPPQTAVLKDGFYMLRCRLAQGKYEVIPRINRILLNNIPGVQIETVIRENLGQGSGNPSQQFELKKPSVFLRQTSEPGQFYIGDIADWPDFLERLQSGQKDSIKLIRKLLKKIGWRFPNNAQRPTDDEKYDLIAGLKQLGASDDLFEKRDFEGFDFTEPYQAIVDSLDACITRENFAKLVRHLIQLAFPDLIRQTKMVVQVQDQPCAWKEWNEVKDFDESGPDSLHYVFDPLVGSITFGNGLNGRVPAPHADIRACFYYNTSGSAGNISAGQQWLIEKANFNRIFGTNHLPAAGGADAEPLDEAEIRARRDFRTVQRAVTLADYERLALEAPGLPIARAKAIPNFDPDYPCFDRPGFVTVVVMPEFWDERPFVEPGEKFIAVAQDYLTGHRLITTAVRVIGPEFVQISVKCTVYVKHKSSPREVTRRIEKALKMFLSPLKRQLEENDTEPVINEWPFGRPVYPSEIYELIDRVEGVDYLLDVRIEARGKYQNKNGVIKIPRYGLVYSGQHEIKTNRQ